MSKKQSDLFDLKAKMKDFGFFPEFSNKSKYLAKMRSKLGVYEANKLLNNIDYILESSENAEDEIAKLIGTNSDLLKIVYSTGIEISMLIFNEMLEILDSVEIEPNIITDLGGANGWSLQLLNDYFDLDSELILIDSNPNWGKVNEKIISINDDYNSISKKLKADLVISIFGILASYSEVLLTCASEVISEKGYFLVALRIPNDLIFRQFQTNAKKLGFGIILGNSRMVEYFNEFNYSKEYFPVLLLSKSVTQIENYDLDQLKLVKYKIK
ncbi:hypothetical protein V7S76_06315 [Aquirufa sp. ROCK2-A2]